MIYNTLCEKNSTSRHVSFIVKCIFDYFFSSFCLVTLGGTHSMGRTFLGCKGKLGKQRNKQFKRWHIKRGVSLGLSLPSFGLQSWENMPGGFVETISPPASPQYGFLLAIPPNPVLAGCLWQWEIVPWSLMCWITSEDKLDLMKWSLGVILVLTSEPTNLHICLSFHRAHL